MSDGESVKGGILSDEIILYGVMGIVALVLIAAVIIWAAITIITMMAQAAARGDFRFVATVTGVIVLAGCVYSGAGLWLRKNGRI